MGVSLAISFDNETENPTDNEVLNAIQKVYAEKIDAVILLSDVENNQFMQMPSGGFHVEYCVGSEGSIYSAEDVPILMANRMFLAYVKGEDSWKTAVIWKLELD